MDIKLDNILVYLDRKASHVGWWKISDFGISSMVEREEPRPSARRRAPALLSVPSPADRLARITGSVRVSANRPGGPYSAPEVAIGNHVGPESDIWSFGCILFQILLRGVGGIRLLTEMDDKRGSFENGSTNDHFCQEGASGQHLHPQVVKWLENPLPRELSYKDTECAKKCRKAISGALKIVPSERPKAHELRKELLKIANGADQYYSDVESVSSFVSNKSRPSSDSPRPQASPNAPPQIRVIPSPLLEPNRPPNSSVDHVPQNHYGFASSSYFAMPPIVENPLSSPQKPPTPPPENYNRPSVSVPQTSRQVSNPDPGPRSSQHIGASTYSGDFHSLPHRPPQFESSYRNPGQDIDSFKELSPSNHMADGWGHVPSPRHLQASNPWEHFQPQPMPNFYHNYGVDRQSYVERHRIYPPAIHERFENPSSPSTSTSSEQVWSPQQRRPPLETQMTDPQPGLETFEFQPPHRGFDGGYIPEDRSRQSSVQSSVPSVEAGPTNDRGETIPFQTPKDTFMTLVSSTRAKIAFVAPNSAIVSTLYSPYSKQTIQPPNNCKWEKGCMAGDYVALRGLCGPTNTQPFHIYRFPTINRALEKQSLFFHEDLPPFEKFAVSRDGRVLLGGSKKVWLYQSW